MEGKQELTRAGGWSGTLPADEEVQLIAHQVIGQVAFYNYKAVSFRRQVVAGVNYIIKVQVTAKDCIHVRVYQGLDAKITLNYVLYGKTLEDPIEIQ